MNNRWWETKVRLASSQQMILSRWWDKNVIYLVHWPHSTFQLKKAQNWSQPTKYIETNEIYHRRWEIFLVSIVLTEENELFSTHACVILECKISSFFWVGQILGRWEEERIYDKICKSRYTSLDALFLHLPTLLQPTLKCSEGITLFLSKRVRAFPLQGFLKRKNVLEEQEWRSMSHKSQLKDNFNRQLLWC